MYRITVLCHKGDATFERTSFEETKELIRKIEDGEVEELPRGRYFLVDRTNKRLIHEIKPNENQEIIMIPVIAGG
jgi:hypothetical protein